MVDALYADEGVSVMSRRTLWPHKGDYRLATTSGDTCGCPSTARGDAATACIDPVRSSDLFKMPSRLCSKSDKSSSGCMRVPHALEYQEAAAHAPACPEVHHARFLDVCRHRKVESVAIPDEVSYRGVVYRLGRLLGKGGFGQVYSAKLDRIEASDFVNADTVPRKVALKVQGTSSNGRNDAVREYNALRMLQGLPGVPDVYAQVPLPHESNVHVMAMQKLGASVWDEFLGQDKELLGHAEIACIAVEALWLLANIHAAGWVHRDVKPENFVLLRESKRRPPRLYLIDFGMATPWRLPDGQALPYGQQLTDFWGTARYASAHAHLGRAASCRDDLQSLAYTLLYLAKGELPWQHLDKTAGMHVKMASLKMSMPLEELCAGLPPVYLQFVQAVMALPFDAAPAHHEYMALFAPLAASVKPNLRPVVVTAPRLSVQLSGTKRLFSQMEADGCRAAAPAERASEWVLVHSKSRPVKQRYHNNITTARLKRIVNAAFRDLMFVTHVVHDRCTGNWTLVMDDGQPYDAQELYVASVSPSVMAQHARQALRPEAEAENFLPQEWITSMWKKGSFITSVAASSMGELLVVMSAGAHFTQQAYRCSHTFPYAWVRRKWKAGFHITSVCCAPWSQCWAVVMSAGTRYTQQVVELDFKYPSDGIQQYWNQGLHITCCAASSRETVFVLSRDSGEGSVCVQETARSPAFPAEHVMATWQKDFYISAICHGPAQP